MLEIDLCKVAKHERARSKYRGDAERDCEPRWVQRVPQLEHGHVGGDARSRAEREREPTHPQRIERQVEGRVDREVGHVVEPLEKKRIRFVTYGRNGVATYGEKGCWGFYL